MRYPCLTRKRWAHALSVPAEHENDVLVVNHGVLPSSSGHRLGEVSDLNPLTSRDVVMPQIFTVIHAVYAVAAKHHQGISFSREPV